ncbi:MAG: hypothetical protein ABI992_13185, partial [Chthoniobacterales bacterium]
MKTIASHLILPLVALFSVTAGSVVAQDSSPNAENGTLETLIVASGTVALDLDMNRLNGAANK